MRMSERRTRREYYCSAGNRMLWNTHSIQKSKNMKYFMLKVKNVASLQPQFPSTKWACSTICEPSYSVLNIPATLTMHANEPIVISHCRRAGFYLGER